jgi:hypothetical protein
MLDSQNMHHWSKARLRRTGPLAAATLALLPFGAGSCGHDWNAVYDRHFPAVATGGASAGGEGGAGHSGAGGASGGAAGNAAAGGSGVTAGGGGAAGTAGIGGTATAGRGGHSAEGGVAGFGGAAGATLLAGAAGSTAAGANAGSAGSAGSAGATGLDCDANLIENSGFEQIVGRLPDQWELHAENNGSGGDWAAVAVDAYAGIRSLQFDTRDAVPSGSEAYAFGVATTSSVAVVPGETLAGRAAARADVQAADALALQLLFFDGSGAPLAEAGSELFPLPTGEEWGVSAPFVVGIPEGAEFVKLVIWAAEGLLAHVDEVCVTR